MTSEFFKPDDTTFRRGAGHRFEAHVGENWLDTKVQIDGKHASLTRMQLEVEVLDDTIMEIDAVQDGVRAELVFVNSRFPTTLTGYIISEACYEKYEEYLQGQREFDQYGRAAERVAELALERWYAVNAEMLNISPPRPMREMFDDLQAALDEFAEEHKKVYGGNTAAVVPGKDPIKTGLRMAEEGERIFNKRRAKLESEHA